MEKTNQIQIPLLIHATARQLSSTPTINSTSQAAAGALDSGYFGLELYLSALGINPLIHALVFPSGSWSHPKKKADTTTNFRLMF